MIARGRWWKNPFGQVEVKRQLAELGGGRACYWRQKAAGHRKPNPPFRP
jgi:hypothetical protein